MTFRSTLNRAANQPTLADNVTRIPKEHDPGALTVMTTRKLKKLIDANEDEFLKTSNFSDTAIAQLTERPDLRAFLLLDRLVRGSFDIVAGAEHDEIFIDVTPEAVAEGASSEDILNLVRCGVRYDSDTDGFAMFV